MAAAFFSPDGQWIGYHSNQDGALKRIPVDGGRPVVICKTDSQLRGASWSVDGTIVFATVNSKGLRRVPASGGDPEVLTTLPTDGSDTAHFWPEVLPDGKAVLFTSADGRALRPSEAVQVKALSLADKRMHTVVDGGSQPRLAPGGLLMFAQRDELLVVPFSTATLKASGLAVTVATGVAHSRFGSAHYALASDGTLAYLTDPPTAGRQKSVVWVDRQGVEEPLNLPPRAYTHARLSPDGTRLALAVAEQGRSDIWIRDLRRDTMERLTTSIEGMGPLWTPDGARVAFSGWDGRTPARHVYWQAADGSSAPEALTTGAGEGLNGFSPDGRALVFVTPVSGPQQPFDLGLLTLGPERRQTVLLATPFMEAAARISPDGGWIAYVSDESGQKEVYVRPFPAVGTSRQLVSSGGGDFPVWSRDGREFFYHVAPGTLMSVRVTPGTPPVLGKPVVVVAGAYPPSEGGGPSYDVSPDGERLLVLKELAAARSELRLVINWADALQQNPGEW